jgi:glycosyltransferase involved in cell wall biosynthesis
MNLYKKTIKMTPILSIIIPTKNRYEYLIVVLNIVRKIVSSELEIIIQDNSDIGASQEKFSNYYNELKDDRIKYFYIDKPLSINENSDRAVLNSSGKFVCFIGDDDCVTSHIVAVAKWMENEFVDVITFNCPAYIWSDVEYKYLSKKHTGVLSYKEPTGKVEIKVPLFELDKLLRKGGQILTEMPQLYHGIASRAILDKIYDITGSFFPGSVPDMDVAVGLSLYSSKYYRIDVPVIISGIAKKSAAGLGAAKMHKGDIRKISTLPKNTADSWDHKIPFFWSGPTIYADSIHKCLIKTGNEKMLDKFNFNYLYAVLYVFNSDYNLETRKAIRINTKASKTKIYYYVFILLLLRSGYFIRNRFPHIFKFRNKKIRFPTITEVVGHIEGMISKMTLPWNSLT